MILEELFSSGVLNIVYASIVMVSFIFALISMLGAEIGDALDFDFDADTDGTFDFISVSPFALAMFGSAFGLAGLIARIWLEMDELPSIMVAVVAGLLIGGVAQAIFLYVLSPSKSSHFSLADDAVGREVEVVISIPKAGKGQIAFDNVSGRVTLGARSASGKTINAGQIVTIEKIVGRVAQVRPLEKI